MAICRQVCMVGEVESAGKSSIGPEELVYAAHPSQHYGDSFVDFFRLKVEST